jgi:REP element-mobilizing transposase RayT
MWNLAAPPGFQGLRNDLPLTVYFRHLPHWRQPGATYFVTFRLADSLPQAKLLELSAWRAEWERRHPGPQSDAVCHELSREVMRRVEAWLDQGMGNCTLRDQSSAAIVAETLRHFDGRRYELASHVIMPNHVHVLVRPLVAEEHALEDVLQSWKQFTAKRINRQSRSSGSLWQDESFDRIVRDEEHLYRCIQYTGTNATRAKLPPRTCPRWVRPEWEAIGWTFSDA